MTGTFDPEANTWSPLGEGWMYTNLHPEDPFCREYGCMIHNPDLEWVGNRESWAYFPRADGRMERICPHGVGHPDPNALRYLVGIQGWSKLSAGTHGCDGCC